MDRARSRGLLLALIIFGASVSGCGGGGGAVRGVMVTTTSLPTGTVNKTYSALLMATGGAPPYSWILTGNTAMPPGLNWDESGDISGTPTTAGTYGPYGFTVYDSNNGTASTGGLTITINAASSMSVSCVSRGNEVELNAANPYAFLLKGTDSAGNPVAIAGSFTPDGKGGISEGAVDYNGITSGAEQLVVNLSASSYGFDSSGDGCVHLVFAGPAAASSSESATTSSFVPANGTRARNIKASPMPASIVSNVELQFNLSDYDGTVYHTGRIVESDGANGSGNSASGIMHVQTPSDFELAALESNYAFGTDGWIPAGQGILRTALGGNFTNRSGNLSASHTDLNAGGAASGELTDGHGAFSSTIDANTGRGMGNFSIMTPSGELSFDFVFYVLNGSDLILLSSDKAAGSNGAPLLAGRALASNAACSSDSLSGSYLLASQGLVVNGSAIGNSAAIGTMNASSNGTIPTATIYSNLAGSYASQRYSNGSYLVEAASGRVSVTGMTATPPVIYLTSGSADDGIAGFVVGTDAEASSGELLRQSGGAPNYTLASLSGNFAAGSEAQVDGLDAEFLGSFMFSGNGGYTVTPPLVGSANNLPHLEMVTIRAEGSGNLDGGRFPFVTNGTALFAIPDSGDPLLLVFAARAAVK